jgi:hypothetical protein
MSTLIERLRRALRSQLEGRLKGPHVESVERIFFIVGNGVTRNAVSLIRGHAAGLSWERWLEKSGGLPGGITVAYLRRLGYSLADIFQYAVRRLLDQGKADEYRALWKALYDSTVDSKPSAVHRAMLAFEPRPTILTTNFDDLLEAADPSAYVVSFSQKDVARGELLEWPALKKPSRAKADIVKIHGSFFRRSADSFDRWWHDRGPENHTVVTRDVYEKVAFSNDFDDRFDIALKPLLNPQSLGIMIGLGFGGEELILSRLFMTAARLSALHARVLVLTTESPADPLFRYERFRPLTAVRIPLGLVASPETRALGWLAALQEIGSLTGLGTDALDRMHREIIQKDIAGREIADTTPLVVSVGQVSYNRVIGLEDALAQESAYAPNRVRRATEKFSWAPDGLDEKPFVLTAAEIGGQSTVPALVLDAMGVPTALVAPLFADDIGDAIVRRLGETGFLDYHWVLSSQTSARPEILGPDVPATENATVVTWFGLRTIVDSYRNLDPQIPTSTEIEGSDRSCFELGAPVYYVSKVGWQQIATKLNAITPKPIVVYDSGGRGAPDREVGVADAGGVIIASARAGLEWLHLATQRPADPADFQGALDALRVESNKWSDAYREKEEAKDDRGRLQQIRQFFIQLKAVGPAPPCLLGWLQGASAFIVTLGDCGAVYWIRGANGWGKPRWSRSEKPVPLSEVRSGLECGDVSRAAFVASLLASRGFEKLTAIPEDAYEWAIAWLNWFGWHKLRFFALDPFLRFVKRQSWTKSDLKYAGGGIPHEVGLHPGEGDAVEPRILIDDVFVGGDLHPGIQEWLKRTKQLVDADRAEWSGDVRRWSDDRFGPRTP